MEVTTAMLADAATVANEKLYVHGGGWDNIYTQQAPTTHPAFGLALIFRLEWQEANKDIPMEFVLTDEDHRQVVLHVEGSMRTGTPAHVKKGAQLHVPFAQMLYGVTFPSLGRYVFHVSTGDKPLVELPISVAALPM